MKIKKDNWKKVRLADVCDRAISIDYRKQSGSFNYVDIGSINSEFNRIKEIQEIDWKNASSRARQVIHKNDTLFSTVRVNLKRVALIDKEIEKGIASTGFTILRAKKNAVNPLYLFYNSVSPKFLDNLIQRQVGTAYPAVTDRIVLNQEILLPTLEEQIQIAELFQSIEVAIEQVEEQEIYLRKTCKSLIDKFVSDRPAFGKLLNGEQLQKVNFTEVAEKLLRKTNAIKDGIERIIGGENLESEGFKIRTWSTVGKDFLGPAFNILFKSGDILYGSRRTYLRKVALADFEGVCANTTYVIRADEKILLQGLLKHIMLSERFTQYSISVSKGSTNPYINWKDLDNFSFQIPDIKTQKEIVSILDEIIELAENSRDQKQTLKKLKQKLLTEILG